MGSERDESVPLPLLSSSLCKESLLCVLLFTEVVGPEVEWDGSLPLK